MPFILYKCTARGQHITRYQYIREVQLAGRSGPIARHVSREYSTTPWQWHLGEENLLRVMVKDNPKGFAIVIDLKPRVEGNVSLYRLRDIWGFSYPEWTPMAWRLEALYRDKRVAEAKQFKKQFDRREVEKKEYVAEFLYLRGGTQVDRWMWGMVGQVNGVLLDPAPFRYFMRELSRLME